MKRRIGIALGVGIVSLLGGWILYYEWRSPVDLQAVRGGVSGMNGWQIDLFQGDPSPLLRRETLKIIILSKGRHPRYSDGRHVRIAGQSLEGIGRVFLVDDRGVTETTAPVFGLLWPHAGSRPANPLAGPNWLPDYLKSVTDPSTWDEPLREFVKRGTVAPAR